MYQSIVVGTDGSSTAERAVAEATRLSKALGSGLHVVAAYEPVRGARVEGYPEAAGKGEPLLPDSTVQTIVDAAAATVRLSGVEVKSHTLTGDPAGALLAVAEQENAGLIVVGSCGMHGMKRVLGSVPNKVAHRARCTVMIVATEGAV
ncbi:MAG: universal stress protein [Solirubrobacterales bacterium]|nr:universal stress protein [Solirubrobacterales bacterium]